MLIFGYGSLMNEASLRKTSKTAEMYPDWYFLPGYQRKCNATHKDFTDVAMNLIESVHYTVEGRVIRFPKKDIPALMNREVGYELVNISDVLKHGFDESVYTFISKGVGYENKYVKQSYIDICVNSVPPNRREQWLLETIVDCLIKKD